MAKQKSNKDEATRNKICSKCLHTFEENEKFYQKRENGAKYCDKCWKYNDKMSKKRKSGPKSPIGIIKREKQGEFDKKNGRKSPVSGQNNVKQASSQKKQQQPAKIIDYAQIQKSLKRDSVKLTGRKPSNEQETQVPTKVNQEKSSDNKDIETEPIEKPSENKDEQIENQERSSDNKDQKKDSNEDTTTNIGNPQNLGGLSTQTQNQQAQHTLNQLILKQSKEGTQGNVNQYISWNEQCLQELKQIRYLLQMAVGSQLGAVITEK